VVSWCYNQLCLIDQINKKISEVLDPSECAAPLLAPKMEMLKPPLEWYQQPPLIKKMKWRQSMQKSTCSSIEDAVMNGSVTVQNLPLERSAPEDL